MIFFLFWSNQKPLKYTDHCDQLQGHRSLWSFTMIYKMRAGKLIYNASGKRTEKISRMGDTKSEMWKYKRFEDIKKI